MTPAQKAGFILGQQYAMRVGNGEGWPAGTLVTFRKDDGSDCPAFDVPTEFEKSGWDYLLLSDLVTPAAVPAVLTFTVAFEADRTAIVVGRVLTSEQVKAVLDIVSK